MNDLNLHEHMKSIYYAEMIIKWLFLAINPGGVVKECLYIKDLIDKVIKFCMINNRIDQDNTIAVLSIIFKILNLLCND